MITMLGTDPALMGGSVFGLYCSAQLIFFTKSSKLGPRLSHDPAEIRDID